MKHIKRAIIDPKQDVFTSKEQYLIDKLNIYQITKQDYSTVSLIKSWRDQTQSWLVKVWIIRKTSMHKTYVLGGKLYLKCRFANK